MAVVRGLSDLHQSRRRQVGDRATRTTISATTPTASSAAVTPRTKLVFLATPNNPTGVATSTRDLAAIIERIPTDVIVVIDEAYREFVDPAFGDPVARTRAAVRERRRHAHLLEGARARRAAARLRDRRPARDRHRRQDAVAVRRQLAGAGGGAGRDRARARDRGARAGHPRRARPGRGRALARRLEAARTTRATSSGCAPATQPTPSGSGSNGAASSCGRSPATACASRSARPPRTTASSPRWRRSWPRAPSRCDAARGSTCGRRGRRWSPRCCSWSSCSRPAASPTCSGGPCAESSSSTPTTPIRPRAASAPSQRHAVRASPPAASRWRRRSATSCSGGGRTAPASRPWPRRLAARAATSRSVRRALRVAATWIVSAGLVSIGRESAIVESGGSLGSVVGRRSGGRGDRHGGGRHRRRVRGRVPRAGRRRAVRRGAPAGASEHAGDRCSWCSARSADSRFTVWLFGGGDPILPDVDGSLWSVLAGGLIVVVPASSSRALFLQLRVRVHGRRAGAGDRVPAMDRGRRVERDRRALGGGVPARVRQRHGGACSEDRRRRR